MFADFVDEILLKNDDCLSVEKYNKLADFVCSLKNMDFTQFSDGTKHIKKYKSFVFEHHVTSIYYDSVVGTYWDTSYIQNLFFKQDDLIYDFERSFLFLKHSVSDAQLKYDYKFFLLKKPLLTLHEATCIVTGYDPQHVEQCQNDTNFKQVFSNYLSVKDYIDSCVDAKMIAYDSYEDRLVADEFKQFLASEDTFIDGFNDDLQNQVIDQNLDNKNSMIDQLKIANEKIKIELIEKEKRIKELELIQTIGDKSKLGNMRAENNVSKLILVLSKMANIDLSKPYSNYEALKIQAELLGMDRFPSDENVASWLKKANSQNPS